jgi:hypothetical protein
LTIHHPHLPSHSAKTLANWTHTKPFERGEKRRKRKKRKRREKKRRERKEEEGEGV